MLELIGDLYGFCPARFEHLVDQKFTNISMQSAQVPHRPGPLHQTNKAHKGGRHNRKASATQEIKTKSLAKPILKQRHDERINQLHQTRKLKRERAFEEKRKLGLDAKPPLTIGLLDMHLNSCNSFIDGLRGYNDKSALRVQEINDRMFYVISARFKMRFKFVLLDASKFDQSLDLAKHLDILTLLYKPQHLEDEDDYETLQLLRSIHINCLPTMMHILDGTQDTSDNSAKLMLNAKRLLRSRLKEERVHSVERSQDYLQLFNILGNCKRQRSQFKSNRTTLHTDAVGVLDGSLTFTGFVREGTMSPNDLVHIMNYGDYQISQIDILSDPISLKLEAQAASQVVTTLRPDPMQQEGLEQENELDPMEGEQTWPTAEELAAEAERKNTRKVIKRLPPGTSEYQGAWISDGSEEEDSDLTEDEDENMESELVDEMQDDTSMKSDDSQPDPEEDSGDEDQVKESAMDIDNYDKNHSKEKEMKILEKLREARLEEMFPDEIDTPPDVPARVRFARYRGLKSFRTSHWDPLENLPPDYSRIFQFKNFHHTKRRVINERSKEGADSGQYVRVHLSNVNQDVTGAVLSEKVPPALVCLLKHERKMTVMNLLIKRCPDSNLSNPIRSKEELIFYVGFRKFKAKPLFTAHSLATKFKYERFLRDDVAMVATVYAPVTFPPAPVLVFRADRWGRKELVASGSVLDSNPNRLVLKRIRLSGHPFKIHSKTAVIRFMFFNAEDVAYFKPVELVTKYNRRGHITEPLGTHGHMKCTFDRKIRSDDCIFMNLYKRVFPKWTYTPIYSNSSELKIAN